MSSRGWFGAALLLAAIGLAGAGAYGQNTTTCQRAPSIQWLWDPCPSSDAADRELQLRLPGGKLKLVLRVVDVPGDNYWCDTLRDVPLGHNDPSDPFGVVRTVQVGGAFPAHTSKSWIYYIGKYEFTFGQAAALVGGGDLRRGVAKLLEMLRSDSDATTPSSVVKELSELPPGDDAEFWDVLAKPARALTQGEIIQILQIANASCFRDAECVADLRARASLGGVPGFLRLPTEIEWEYAARGGGDALRDRTFGAPAPWRSNEEHNRYAVSKSYPKWLGAGLQRIGGERLPSRGGLYDILGNAAELTSDIFGTDVLQGRAGGLAARGGSRADVVEELSFARRGEVPLYQWQTSVGGNAPAYRGVYRDTWLGFRPVLVSVDVPNAEFFRTLPPPFAEKCRGASGDRSAEAAKDLGKDIEKLPPAGGTSPEAEKQLAEVKIKMERLTSTLIDNSRRLCRNVFVIAYNTARNVLTDHSANVRFAIMAETRDKPEEREKRDDDERRSEKYGRFAELGVQRYKENVDDAAAYPADCSDKVADEIAASLGESSVEVKLVEQVRQHIHTVRDSLSAVRDSRRLTPDRIKADLASTEGKSW